jgi:hypothetical protein
MQASPATHAIEIELVAARLGAADLIGRCAHLGDRGRLRELTEQYVPHGVLVSGQGDVCTGRAEILAYLERTAGDAAASASLTFARHHVSSIHLTFVATDRVEASSYFAAISDIGVDHSGSYRDVIVHHDGQWLLERRSVRLDSPPRWGRARGTEEDA